MSTITREWLQQTIAEYEANRDELPFGLDTNSAIELQAFKLALASLEAEAVCVIDQSNLDYLKSGSDADVWPASRTEMGDVLLYRSAQPAPVSVNDERYQHLSELYHAQEKRLFKLAQRIKGPSFDKYAHSPSQAIDVLESALFGDSKETSRAAKLQGADEKAELTVWYGSMPESNGKANWTAILHRKGEGRCMDGFTIDRSEYPGRVLYAADRVRYLIGEKSERPSILDYDADAHSGYVKTCNSPVIQDGWAMVPKEPTAEMLQSGISAHYERSQIQIHDRPAQGPMECAYVAMLAAAPQQEAKNV